MSGTLSPNDVEMVKKALKQMSFLQYLTPVETGQLVAGFEKVTMRKGDVLIEQGTTGSIFYIVAAGSVGVYRKRAFLDQQIHVLGPGSFFGEGALISNKPRSATCACEEDGILFTLLRDTFRNVLLGNPHISEVIIRTAEKRKAELVDLDINERMKSRKQNPGPGPS
jgi:CRP-like cAMP-binding protein